MPPLPRVPVSAPELTAVAVNADRHVYEAEAVSLAFMKKMKEAEHLCGLISSNFITLEESAAQCRHIADLDQIVTRLSLERLQRIHTTERNGVFYEIMQFFKRLSGLG